jgi:sulfide:quinone oxidoreductase
MKTIVILGGGTGGTIMANRLAARFANQHFKIVVVERDLQHVYQPGLLFLPFGSERKEDLVRDRAMFLPPGVELVLNAVERIEPDANKIVFGDGTSLRYDFLIIATGTRIVPEATEGLKGAGWQKNIFDFYTLDGASKLQRALESWQGGRLVVNVVEMPIKCPVAPLEFLFLADAHFTRRNMRSRVELVCATPLDGVFTKPRASALLGDVFTSRGIRVEANYSVQSVDSEKRVLRSYDGRAVEYDLLVTVPQHQGSEIISRSGLGDDLGFIPTDRHTLQSKAFPNIFALGDATDLPASKAGSVVHFESEVLIENVASAVEGRPLASMYDGHANCFIETGYEKGMLIDFNYETEPLPGRFPLPGIGPFTLLEESHVNHWGKLGFKWVYWNLLLKGAELPMDHRMAMAGKWR